MTPRTRRLTAGAVLGGVAVAAVFFGRQTPLFSADVPAYRRDGPRRAPVRLVEYSDFQCPRCADAQPHVKALRNRYPEDVAVVFRHMPLKMHANAVPAARASEAAGLQGRFWDYADLLYERQKTWGPQADPWEEFNAYARELGLDENRFAADATGQRVADIVDRERAHAEAVPVNATPTFFINDMVLVGDTQLAARGTLLVERELAR